MENVGTKSYYIKWAISIALGLVFFLMPEGGVVTFQLKAFLAITAFGLALAAFELAPLLAIAMFMPGAWLLCGVATVQQVMQPWLGTTTILLFGAFFLAATLDECGLLKRIAYWLMCRVKGSLFGLLLALMVVGIIMNIITAGMGNVIMAALCAGLFLALDRTNVKLGVLLATAAFLGTCTSHAYTYEAGSWAVILGLAKDFIPAGTITPTSIMLHNWPMFLVSVAILFVIYKWYKLDQPIGEVSYFQEEYDKLGKMDRREKVNLLMVIVLLFYLFVGVTVFGWDLNLGMGLIPWMVYLPGLNGADKDTWRKMPWDSAFFVMSCMAVGMVATSLGLADVLGEWIKTLLAGNTSPFAIMAILFLIVFVLNFLMTPLAIWSLALIPVLTLATSAGYDPVPFAYAIRAVSEAIILPYEYVPYLVVFAFGMISMKDFIKTNIVRSAMFFVGYLVVLVPYWMLLGLL